jgi:hypothetical protein
MERGKRRSKRTMTMGWVGLGKEKKKNEYDEGNNEKEIDEKMFGLK